MRHRSGCSEARTTGATDRQDPGSQCGEVGLSGRGGWRVGEEPGAVLWRQLARGGALDGEARRGFRGRRRSPCGVLTPACDRATRRPGGGGEQAVAG